MENYSTQTQELVEFEKKTDLSPELNEKVQKIAKEINVNDSTFVIGYGSKSQKDISMFSDKILEHVRTKDTGDAGSVLTELMLKVKEVDASNLASSSGLSKVPIIGSLFNKAKKYIAQYEKVNVHIEKIMQQLDKTQKDLIKDITMLDGLYQKNQDYFVDLNLYIEAGKIKLQEIREQVIPVLKKNANESNDPQAAQKLADMNQFIDRFEKKLHDLLISRTIAQQTAPQIRLIQNNNQVLVQKIQTSMVQTIPLWKQQLAIALTIARQQKAVEIQKEVSNTTNDLLLKNAEMLKVGSVEVAKENERGIVDIETLQKTQADLIATLEETLNIQAEGRRKRQEAEVELKNMEQELKRKLLEFNEKQF